MSQASGMTGGSVASGSKSGNKAIPVLLLAIAVALGVALLHDLDNTPTVTEATLQTTQEAQESAAAVPAVVTPATLAVRSPSEVKVLVTNGTTTSGVAAKINSRLQPIGYQLGTPGNTTTASAQSTVQYVAGYEAEAQAVASSLGLASSAVIPMATPAPVADIQAANVIVVIGSELAASTAATTATSSATGAAATGNGATATTVAGSTATTASASAGLNGPLANLNSATTTPAR